MSRAKTTPATPAVTIAEPIPAAVPLPPARAIADWLSAQEIKARKDLIHAVLSDVMKKGLHYGPGFPGDEKHNLLKPGADVLLMTFQLYADLEVDERQYPGDHREYSITARIRRISDQLVVAIGVGTCSTLETKYRYRKGDGISTERAVPREYWDARKFQPKEAQEMLGGKGFFPKKVDSGWIIFEASDRVENPNPPDCWNTCLKIAKKRAAVDGTISATGASDIFAQDVEDDAGEQQNEPRAAPTTGPAAPLNAKADPVNGPAPAVNAGKAPANTTAAADELKTRMDAAYGRLQQVGGNGFALKVWRHYPNDQRAQRADACDQAAAAIAGIQSALPQAKADELLTSLINDHEPADDVPGIIAALVKAAPPVPAAPVDQPPY